MAPEAERPIWTTGRKIVPNLLPLLFGVPFWAVAPILAKRGMFIDTVMVAAFGLIACAVSLNWLGLTGNEQMRGELETRLHPERGAIFVGISRPGYAHWLDPHEDIGFLTIRKDEIEIRGERIRLVIPRSNALRFGYAFNPHAALGLGRWLTISGGSESPGVKVQIEPRESLSLRANRTLGAELKNKLETWVKG